MATVEKAEKAENQPAVDKSPGEKSERWRRFMVKVGEYGTIAILCFSAGLAAQTLLHAKVARQPISFTMSHDYSGALAGACTDLQQILEATAKAREPLTVPAKEESLIDKRAKEMKEAIARTKQMKIDLDERDGPLEEMRDAVMSD